MGQPANCLSQAARRRAAAAFAQMVRADAKPLAPDGHSPLRLRTRSAPARWLTRPRHRPARSPCAAGSSAMPRAGGLRRQWPRARRSEALCASANGICGGGNTPPAVPPVACSPLAAGAVSGPGVVTPGPGAARVRDGSKPAGELPASRRREVVGNGIGADAFDCPGVPVDDRDICLAAGTPSPPSRMTSLRCRIVCGVSGRRAARPVAAGATPDVAAPGFRRRVPGPKATLKPVILAALEGRATTGAPAMSGPRGSAVTCACVAGKASRASPSSPRAIAPAAGVADAC